nr:hypothetical protein [candidate division Zixibacteria bacterium]
MLKKSIVLIPLLAVLILIPFREVLSIEITRSGFLDRHMAGGRIGVWTNTGDNGTQTEEIDFSKSSVYAEFFYAHRLARPLAVEIMIGIYSRGDVEYRRDDELGVTTFTSSVNLYPIFVSAKFYPLYKIDNIPFHLYLQPGVGLVYGSQNVISYDEYYSSYYGFVYEESRAKFTYMLSGGIDLPLTSQLALTSNAKYVPVKFGKNLAQVKDYSGWSITLGVGYVFSK